MKSPASKYHGWAVAIVDSPRLKSPRRRFAGRYWWFGHRPETPEPQLAGHTTSLFATRREARLAIAGSSKTGSYRLVAERVCVTVRLAP
jgi:hypothetical protein